MNESPRRHSSVHAEAALAEDSCPSDTTPYLLRLYIVGQATGSTLAVAAIKSICETYLHNQYELEVIDLYRHPLMAQRDQIIVAPTLIRVRPAPACRFIGDFAKAEDVLTRLSLNPRRLGMAGT